MIKKILPPNSMRENTTTILRLDEQADHSTGEILLPERVTTCPNANEQLLYFTSSSLWEDDNYLVFISDRTDDPNLFLRCLTTGREIQLTHNQEGYLKSYVYFDGNPYSGFGKASVSLHPPSGTVYYLQGRSICKVTPDGVVNILNEYPEGQMIAFTHVSSDGKYLCVPTTDARALDDERRFPGKPPYSVDQRVREENLNSYLHIYDTTTGDAIHTEVVPRCWITHVQFNPRNPRQLLYNHEYAADCGIRRMWLWDGHSHRRLRTEGSGRSRQDWTSHEMWVHDGSGIIYHGRYANGISYLGRIRLDDNRIEEISLPEAWNRYGHFIVGANGLLVSDGCYTHQSDPEHARGQWISLVKVDWSQGSSQWMPLCRSGSSWNSQDSHPHPIFDHACNWIYFTSDAEGHRMIYRIRVKDFSL